MLKLDGRVTVCGWRGQADEGRVAFGGALTSATPGELGGFGYVGAQWPNGLLVRFRAHDDA